MISNEQKQKAADFLTSMSDEELALMETQVRHEVKRREEIKRLAAVKKLAPTECS